MYRFPESGRNISKQICETTGAELRKRCRTAEIVLHIHLHSQWQQYLIIEALLLFNHTHLRKQNKIPTHCQDRGATDSMLPYHILFFLTPLLLHDSSQESSW